MVEPRVGSRTVAEEVEQIWRTSASHAMGERDDTCDGRQGVRLGRPGVSVLDVFRKEYETWIQKTHPEQMHLVAASSKRGRKPETKEKTAGYSIFKPSVQTRAWGDDLREGMRRRLHREIEDDELLRRAFAVYEQQGHQASQLPRRKDGVPTSGWEQLHVPVEVQSILREGMVQTGASDLLSYLLAGGEREARRQRSLARKQTSACYAGMPSSKLVGMKVPGAGMERYRRAVYTLMQWNEEHAPQEQWYLTTLSMQKLVGGRKHAIAAYLDAHRDDIEEHHHKLDIKPSVNRKAEPITEVITIAEEPTAFPWGKAVTIQEEAGEHGGR